MGRLKAKLTKSAVDQEIQGQVAEAARAVEKAIRTCRGARKGPGETSRRVDRVLRDLHRARGALGNVGHVATGRDMDDPDLMSEKERSRLFHEARDAERAERAERIERSAAPVETGASGGSE